MLRKLITLISSVIIILTVVVFDKSVVGDISNTDGKYSIYVNNVFYGNVSDRKPFDDYIEKTYKKYNKESKYGEVFYPENYSINSVASAFDTSMSDLTVLSEFKKEVEFLVDGYKLSVLKGSEYANYNPKQGGEPTINSSSGHSVIYSTSKEEFDNAFDKILQTFVDEDSIDRIARGEEVESFIPGTEETIAYNVGGYVVGLETKVPYDEILTGDSLYNKMMFYNIGDDKLYSVKDGDSLEKIASENMLNVNELVAANESLVSENTILSPGQELIVNLVNPVVTVESTKLIVKEEVQQYETEVIADPNMLTTDIPIVNVEGSDGKVVRVYKIDYLNGQTTSGGEIVSENQLVEPVNRVIVKGTKASPSYSASYSSGSSYTKSVGVTDGRAVAWTRPTTGGYLSSPYGARWGTIHYGTDIAGMPTGSTIMSIYDGIVVYSGYHGSYGNFIIIDHKNGYVSYYAHLSVSEVVTGDSVVKGQRIGGMGTTGNSTGVHLHLEIYVNGERVDPMSVYQWI